MPVVPLGHDRLRHTSEEFDPILRLARTALAGGDDDGAAELFEQAARVGTPRVLGKIAEAYGEVFDGRAADWMSRAVAAVSVPGGITVHPGTLRIIAQHGFPEQQVWSVTVRASEEDRAAAVTALEAAVPRLMRITDDGRELTVGGMEAALDSGVDFYSPNYRASPISFSYTSAYTPTSVGRMAGS
ncbi:hypothetical protein ABT160_40875 [Streptomyces sp. NPDC001941]|uniref:hypothetical protein n=1 Tax=Streptomyces sp. NPDC001941 TaxID=3154659 RepID=UPI003332F170